MTLVAEIKTKQLEETQRAEFKSAKLEINIKALSEQNNKMTAEIEHLKSTIVKRTQCKYQVCSRYKTKRVDEGGDKSKKSTRNMNTNKIPLKANTFQTLDAEESNPSNGYNYKDASQTKTASKGSPTHHRNGKESNMDPRNTADTNKRHNQEKQEKVLVIGDSMVKHVDGN